MKPITAVLLTVLTAMTTMTQPSALRAELRSPSREIVVLLPTDLPEAAQIPGNSLFLHSDDEGSTFLYVEQKDGGRLAIFNVTDPAHIKLVSSTPLSAPGAFDFVRPLGERSELIRCRDGKGVAVLDLTKPDKPTFRIVSALADPGETEPLGTTGFLSVDEPYNFVRATPRDFQVVDISTPSSPVLVTTVKGVKHRVVNNDTGTTYLLGSDGLTVIRRISVEEDFKTHLFQTQN